MKTVMILLIRSGPPTNQIIPPDYIILYIQIISDNIRLYQIILSDYITHYIYFAYMTMYMLAYTKHFLRIANHHSDPSKRSLFPNHLFYIITHTYKALGARHIACRQIMGHSSMENAFGHKCQMAKINSNMEFRYLVIMVTQAASTFLKNNILKQQSKSEHLGPETTATLPLSRLRHEFFPLQNKALLNRGPILPLSPHNAAPAPNRASRAIRN